MKYFGQKIKGSFKSVPLQVRLPIIFFFTYSLLSYMHLLFPKDIWISVNVQELEAQHLPALTSLRMIINILIGPIFAVFAYHIYVKLKTHLLEKTEGKENRSKEVKQNGDKSNQTDTQNNRLISQKEIAMRDYLFVIFLLLFVMGNSIHYIGNYHSNLAVSEGLVYSNTFLGLYFYEELVAHLLILISIMGMGNVYVSLILVHKKPTSLKRSLRLGLHFVGLTIGCGIAIMMIEGQSALVGIIPLLFIFITVKNARKTKQPLKGSQSTQNSSKYSDIVKDYPIVKIFILIGIWYVVSVLIYVGLYGTTEVYPFLPQPSLLFS